ncbi:MAG: DUF1304 domain-containing protein [Flavobacterium sp.]|nr:MAG: DUF1304 domain-containing protein [Flavobacterium sp.]
MGIVTKIVIGLVATIHVYIMWLEMFAWLGKGRKVFRTIPADMFEKTKTMAGNQGLYNGFLAAGLIWSLCINDSAWASNVATFFLACVFIAGIYGALTVQKKIFYVQSVPAAVALIVLYLNF